MEAVVKSIASQWETAREWIHSLLTLISKKIGARGHWVSCFTILLVSGCGQVESESVYQTVQGPAVTSSSLENKWQVINYWATWCGPCITEIPELNELAHEYSVELVVLGVDFDAPSTATAAMASIEKMGIEFPVLTLDPAMRLGIDTPTVLPTTVLVHPDGEVREVLVGPQTAASLLAVINPVTSGAE